MLNRIIKFSLENRYIVLLASLLLVIFGVRTATRMEVDVFPDLTAPTVVVMTDAHGMASEEVERLVTFPVEAAVNGATDVRRVRSVSSYGYSFVWVEFDWDTDIFKARQIVSEKIAGASARMPQGVSQPVLAPQSSVMGEIFFVGLRSDSLSMMELRTLAEWNIKPVILATDGVSQVTIIGGDYKQYQVVPDLQKMNFYRIAMDDLITTCRNIGTNASGGLLRQFGNEYVVRGIARTSDIETMEQTLVKQVNGKPVRIGDIAEIRIGSAPAMGYASGNAQPAVIISVSRQPNANTLEVTRNIEAKLDDLAKALPRSISMDTNIFRQADFIETSISNVQQALIEGGIFVTIILLLFLGSFRTTLISLVAIPLSLLGAVLVLKMLGMSINTMSLGGMAIAVGSLVDDAIIDVENVYKRLRQNHLKPIHEQQSAFNVVYQASREIRSSILNATLIIMVAFLPLFFLSGMEGRMLQPLGIAFIVSLFVSLLVAMTLTPLLSQLMLSGEKHLAKNVKEKWLAGKLVAWYEKSLSGALRHKRPIIFTTLALFIVSLVVFSTFGRSFLPEFNEGALTISVVTQPGTSLEISNKLGNIAETELLSLPEVVSTARRTGRGELDEHSQTSNSAEIDVNFVLKNRSQQEFMIAVRETLSGIPGIAFTVGQPLGHRIDHMLSGTRANIAVKLFGTDLNRMYATGNEIKSRMATIPGIVDVNPDQQVEIPQIQIRAHRNMLAQYGITLEQFNHFIEIALGNEKLIDIYEGQQTFDLVIRLDSMYIGSAEGLRSILMDGADGKKVPLDQLAEIVTVSGPGTITRENVQRKLVIAANVAGRDLHGAVLDIRKEVEKIRLPEGFRIEYGGQFESEAKASRTLLLTSVIAILVIFMLLYYEFRDFKLAGIILLNLPMALIGGVFSIWITSGNLSIPAIIGFITLFGIATRNGILLISNYQKLRLRGESLHNLIIRGSSDRLNAILMTALTAALALLPLAIRGHQSGNEIQSPMARVILGGLLTSTLLNIYVVPVVYHILYNRHLIKQPEK